MKFVIVNFHEYFQKFAISHLRGKFRAALCSSFNLERQEQKYITICIQGTRNHDSQFTARQLGYDIQNVHVIPNTKEKYTSFANKHR